jgi:hypothetical protein
VTSAARNDWVVTYRIEVGEWEYLVEEFYRGDFHECKRIMQYSMSGGESDMRKTPHPWQPTICPAREWDKLVEGARG